MLHQIGPLLLDTNVVSETRRPSRSTAFAEWWSNVDVHALHLSALTLGEIQRGAEMLRIRDAARATPVDEWLTMLADTFSDRIIPVTEDIARVWGRMSADRTRPPIDTLLAATAKVHGLTLVTRNTRDFAGIDVELFDPFRLV